MVRTVASTQSEMTEIILPNDTNTLGNLLGGRLMHFIDLTGAMAAYRHARTHVVTAAMDHIDFIRPVRLGDLLTLKSSVNRAFTSSMEVGVKVWAENTRTGEVVHVASAYLVFVAIDEHGQTSDRFLQLKPETPDEMRRHADAMRRREHREAEHTAPQGRTDGYCGTGRSGSETTPERSEDGLEAEIQTTTSYSRKGATKNYGAFLCHAFAGGFARCFEDYRGRFRQGRRGQNHRRGEPGHCAFKAGTSVWD